MNATTATKQPTPPALASVTGSAPDELRRRWEYVKEQINHAELSLQHWNLGHYEGCLDRAMREMRLCAHDAKYLREQNEKLSD